MKLIELLRQALEDKRALHALKRELNSDYSEEDLANMQAEEDELAFLVAQLLSGKGGPNIIVEIEGDMVNGAWCDIPAELTIIDKVDMEADGAKSYLQERGFHNEAELRARTGSMHTIW
ncbi:hypothetical protein [Chromobacterium phragmitis]|uniref:Uncharacterized protein n=1 Tax=Chromobacterium phragmitis TaxID=2202141 RepID=A0ABV0J2G0_9NEIS